MTLTPGMKIGLISLVAGGASAAIGLAGFPWWLAMIPAGCWALALLIAGVLAWMAAEGGM